MEKDNPTLIIAGGGTGGHVLAGIAVADEWKSAGGKVIFVGAKGGIEERLVPRAGYPLELLSLGSLNQVSLQRKVKTLFQLPLSLLKSLAILISHRPKAVLGVGGYASGPLVLMARMLGIHSAILEQNSVPGLTNRILGKSAHRIFSAFPGTESGFASAKLLVTGNPVRAQMKPLAAASRRPFTIFVFGGSQGAQGINTLVIESLPFLEDLRGDLRWIHQTGEKDFARIQAAHDKARTQSRVEKFIYEMPAAYLESSLIICRAGSSTLAEVAAVGRAAVLVPFPFAADNHQEKNARVFSEVGAAKLLVQKTATGKDLALLIRDAYQNSAGLEAMEKKVAEFYRPDSARVIAQDLRTHAN